MVSAHLLHLQATSPDYQTLRTVQKDPCTLQPQKIRSGRVPMDIPEADDCGEILREMAADVVDDETMGADAVEDVAVAAGVAVLVVADNNFHGKYVLHVLQVVDIGFPVVVAAAAVLVSKFRVRDLAILVMDTEFPAEMGFEFLLARGTDSPMTDYDDGQLKTHQSLSTTENRHHG